MTTLAIEWLDLQAANLLAIAARMRARAPTSEDARMLRDGLVALREGWRSMRDVDGQTERGEANKLRLSYDIARHLVANAPPQAVERAALRAWLDAVRRTAPTASTRIQWRDIASGPDWTPPASESTGSGALALLVVVGAFLLLGRRR